MGKDLYDEYDDIRELFAAAQSASGLPISDLCFEGPLNVLTETVNLQPAVTVVNLACLAAVRKAGIQPSICAGHSLGEYGALCAAGVVSTEDCIRLVHKRGELMHREAMRLKGAMSAIIGLNIDQVNAVVARAAENGVVAVANYNSAEQIVITGEPDAVKAASAIAGEQGGRAIALKVSGAWHSPLIQGAEEDFKAFLETIDFQPPQCPVIHNVTADVEKDPAQIKTLMAEQLCSPVRWFDTMERMTAEAVDAYVEIGPGKVLTGLLKKCLPKDHPAAIYNIDDLRTLDRFLQDI